MLVGSEQLRYTFPVLIVVLVLGALLAVMLSSKDGGAFDLTLAELLEDSDEFMGREVRVNGRIVKNSFRERKTADGAIDIEFGIGNTDGQKVTVRYHQILPDAFEEGREVIVAGKLIDDHTIECTRLTVKCPSKYKDEKMTDARRWDEYKNTFQEGSRLPVVKPPVESGGSY